MSDLCPCDTGKKYSECCQLLHNGAYPENALALMRSRYSAYAKHLVDYIMHTTHPENKTFRDDRIAWSQEISKFSSKNIFIKLVILNFTDGPEVAYVTFIAHLNQNNRTIELIEKSRFIKVGPQWLYRDGTHYKNRAAAL